MKFKAFILSFIMLILVGFSACTDKSDIEQNTASSLEETKVTVNTVCHVYNAENGQTDIIGLDIITGKTNHIASTQRPISSCCAYSAKYNTVAYSSVTSTDPSAAEFLVIHNLTTNKEHIFFDDTHYFQWINGICFDNDGNVIVNMTIGENQEVSAIRKVTFESETVTDIHKVDFSSSKELSETEINELVQYWGINESTSANETNSGFYVKFSAPVFSADENKLYYSAVLCRTATPPYIEGDENFPLIELASSIWAVDFNSTNPTSEKIYTNLNPRTYIGELTYIDSNKLLFENIGYSQPFKQKSELQLLDITSFSSKTLTVPNNEKLLQPVCASGNTVLLQDRITQSLATYNLTDFKLTNKLIITN